MIAKTFAAGLIGLSGFTIEIEADSSNGLPATIIVGLPDTAVQESRERIKLALVNSGFHFPASRLAINLAPADKPKNGSLYDLAIAISVLQATGQIRLEQNQLALLGELALDGTLRPISGVLALVEYLAKQGFEEIFLPKENASEASLISGVKIYGCGSLREVTDHLLKIKPLVAVEKSSLKFLQNKAEVDFADIAGQAFAKRAIEIACAGGHNLLMIGPPGVGKTLLAKAAGGILPPLSESEIIELTKIYSIAGQLASGIISSRPVRHPHHSSSHVALIGGGSNAKPGEVTLAHHGILFLDEFPEFSRATLETLRQPLEDGYVTVARAKQTVIYPAQSLLLAAANPCPCGFFGTTQKCKCPPSALLKYRAKLSGPLLDRIDLHINLSSLSYDELKNGGGGETTASISARVSSARKVAEKRLGPARVNASMSAKEIKKFISLREPLHYLLKEACEKFNLSGRGVSRTLKVAQTIADLDNSAEIKQEHLLEALNYRTSG